MMGACMGKQNSGKTKPLLQDSQQDIQVSSEYPYDAKVTFDFFGSDEHQLTIQRNEIVIIIDGRPELNGWALAKRKDDHRQGYIPLDYTRKMDKSASSQRNSINDMKASIDDSKNSKASLFEAEEIESLLFNELDQVDVALKSRISKDNHSTQI